MDLSGPEKILLFCIEQIFVKEDQSIVVLHVFFFEGWNVFQENIHPWKIYKAEDRYKERYIEDMWQASQVVILSASMSAASVLEDIS